LKPVELLSHRPAQSWRGASADPSLECSFAGASVGTGTVAEFVTLWSDDTKGEPQAAIGKVDAAERWNIAISPRQTESEINQVLHLATKIGQLDIVYQADVTPGTTERFQYRVAVPEDFSVEHVQVVRDGKPTSVRWTRPENDRINLLFENELVVPYRAIIHGSLAFEGNSSVVPRIAAIGTTSVSSVQLYRDSSVLLSITGLPDGNDAINVPLDSPPASWSARYVAGYRLGADQLDKLRLNVQPNEVQLNGDSVTSLVRSSQGWISRYESNLSIGKGALDVLHYQTDSVWSDAPVLECSVPATLSMVGGDDGSSHIAIRFADTLPQGTTFNLKFEAPIVAASGNVVVPKIRPETPMNGTHYVRVPTLVDSQPVAWALNGVQSATVPASFRTFPSQRVDVRTFAVNGDDFQVQMRPRLGLPRPARVRLVDTEINSDPATGHIIRTVFIVEPQGLHDCTIRLPQGQRLVDVQIASRAALVRYLRENDWSVVLGPSPLPCRLEVLSRSDESPTGLRQTEIQRALLLAGASPIPVEMSVWSIGYRNTASKPAIGMLSEATADEIALLRFDRMLSIAEAATAVAVELPMPDGRNWYRQWASALGRLRDEARNTLAGQGNLQMPSQVTRPYEEQIAASSRRLDAWIARCDETVPAMEPNSSLAAADARGDADDDALEWADTLPTPRRVYCLTDGNLDRLTLRYPSLEGGPARTPFLAVAIVICLAIAASVAIGHARVRDLLYRWPHAIAFLVGIACWAWLQPSWLGLLISGASVFFACRSGWPGRAIRTDASTVLRTGHPH
jgi:hypothetical protein